MRRCAAVVSISIATLGLMAPAQAQDHHARNHLQMVCTQEGGNGRYWISFQLSDAARPEIGSAPVTLLGNTEQDGWVALPGPTWAQPGTVITGLDAVSSRHGRVSQIRLTYGTMTAQAPTGYGRDCTYAGFPAWPVPTDLHLTRINATTARVAWTSRPGSRYTIGWYEVTAPNRFWQSSIGGYGASSSPLTLTGLRPAGIYRIFIVPVRDGRQDWPQWQEVWAVTQVSERSSRPTHGAPPAPTTPTLAAPVPVVPTSAQQPPAGTAQRLTPAPPPAPSVPATTAPPQTTPSSPALGIPARTGTPTPSGTETATAIPPAPTPALPAPSTSPEPSPPTALGSAVPAAGGSGFHG